MLSTLSGACSVRSTSALLTPCLSYWSTYWPVNSILYIGGAKSPLWQDLSNRVRGSTWRDLGGLSFFGRLVLFVLCQSLIYLASRHGNELLASFSKRWYSSEGGLDGLVFFILPFYPIPLVLLVLTADLIAACRALLSLAY